MSEVRHDYSLVNPSPASSLGQWLALVIGFAFTGAGIAGFVVTGFDQFASQEGESLLGLEVNPLHNVVHLTLGLGGLWAWSRPARAYAYGVALAAIYLPMFLYGLVAMGEVWDVLSINTADNLLHLGTGLAGIAIAASVNHDRETAGPLRY